MDEFTSIPSLPVLDLGNVGRKRVNGEKGDARQDKGGRKWDKRTLRFEPAQERRIKIKAVKTSFPSVSF